MVYFSFLNGIAGIHTESCAACVTACFLHCPFTSGVGGPLAFSSTAENTLDGGPPVDASSSSRVHAAKVLWYPCLAYIVELYPVGMNRCSCFQHTVACGGLAGGLERN